MATGLFGSRAATSNGCKQPDLGAVPSLDGFARIDLQHVDALKQRQACKHPQVGQITRQTWRQGSNLGSQRMQDRRLLILGGALPSRIPQIASHTLHHLPLLPVFGPQDSSFGQALRSDPSL